MKRTTILASKTLRNRVLFAISCALGLLSVSGCASSFQGITIDSRRVFVLRADVILECQSRKAPFACREVTRGEQTWNGVQPTPALRAPTEVIRIPDGVALLLRGMEVIVRMSDETVLRGTVGEPSSAQTLTIVMDSKQVTVVSWSAVSSVALDPGKENPYD